MSFIRVTLIQTTPKSPILQMDIPDTDFVLSGGTFQPVQTAPTITLVGVPVAHQVTPFDNLQAAIAVTDQQKQEVKVVFREPVTTAVNSDAAAIVQPDPTGGVGVYGITLNETRITFAPVTVAP